MQIVLFNYNNYFSKIVRLINGDIKIFSDSSFATDTQCHMNVKVFYDVVSECLHTDNLNFSFSPMQMKSFSLVS